MTFPRCLPDPRQPAALAGGAVVGLASTLIAVGVAGWLLFRAMTRTWED